jgi:hypothetical protein
MASDFPTNITVLLGRMTVNKEDGKEVSNADGIYNHHTFLYDVARGFLANIQCEGSKTDIAAVNAIKGSAANASGLKLETFTGALNRMPIVGDYTDNSSKLLINGDLVNYNKDVKDVYMVLDMHYIEGKGTGLLEPAAHLISVGVCDNKPGTLAGMLGGLFMRPPHPPKARQCLL